MGTLKAILNFTIFCYIILVIAVLTIITMILVITPAIITAVLPIVLIEGYAMSKLWLLLFLAFPLGIGATIVLYRYVKEHFDSSIENMLCRLFDVISKYTGFNDFLAEFIDR